MTTSFARAWSARLRSLLWASKGGLDERTARLIADFRRALDEPTRVAVIRAIGDHGTVRSIEALGAFAAADRPYATEALAALTRIPGHRAEPGLIRFLESREPNLVIEACRALARQGTDACRGPLRGLVQGLKTPWELNHAAQEALQSIEQRQGEARNAHEGQVSVVQTSSAGALSVSEDGGAISVEPAPR